MHDCDCFADLPDNLRNFQDVEFLSKPLLFLHVFMQISVSAELSDQIQVLLVVELPVQSHDVAML